MASAKSIAAYTMYGGEAMRPAIRAFWGGVAARLKDAGLKDVPARLTWDKSELELWRAPSLLLAQTCGFPLMKGVTGPVRLVATPIYDVPYTDGASYVSLVIVARNSDAASLMDLRGRVAAINKPTSHSGCNAFRRLVADYAVQADGGPAEDVPGRAGGRQFFAAVKETGHHLKSLRAVAAGRADVAAIDCVSFHFIGQEHPRLMEKVRILTTTLPAPGLPFITAHWRSDDEVTALRAALADAVGDPALRPAISKMRLKGMQVLLPAVYGRTLEMERAAEDLGYPKLQ